MKRGGRTEQKEIKGRRDPTQTYFGVLVSISPNPKNMRERGKRKMNFFLGREAEEVGVQSVRSRDFLTHTHIKTVRRDTHTQ